MDVGGKWKRRVGGYSVGEGEGGGGVDGWMGDVICRLSYVVTEALLHG